MERKERICVGAGAGILVIGAALLLSLGPADTPLVRFMASGAALLALIGFVALLRDVLT